MSRTSEMMGSQVASAAASVTTSAVALATIKESAIKATIQQILALRSGPPTVSSETEKTIARVQAELARSTESWKKVDWRGAKRGNKPGHAPYSNSSSSSSSNSSSSSSSQPYTRGPSSLAPRGSGPPPKYVSRFKASEKVDDAILLLIQGKLNKFSQRNYVETHAFMCQILDEGKTHFLKDFMKFVFQKATREELMCPSYAQLLCELASKYTVLLTEMVERYREFSAIFADISEEELSVEDYKALLEANSDKAYRLGYAQFLGELAKYNVLDTALFVESIGSIVGKIPAIADATNGKRLLEDYCECLIRILRAIHTEKSSVATSLRTIVKERFLEPLMPYTVKGCCASYKSLSPKGRCMILDITDMVKKF
jgi:hypothetical protein